MDAIQKGTTTYAFIKNDKMYTGFNLTTTVLLDCVVIRVKMVCFISIHYNLYNTVRYNTVLDITWFKDGSQKCIDYIEK